MPWVNTATIDRGLASGNTYGQQIYNGLDCCVTLEVWESQQRDLAVVPHAANAKLIYSFERAMQGPSFAMTRRGVRVDKTWRGIVRNELEREYELHWLRFQKLAEAVWGIPRDTKVKKYRALNNAKLMNGTMVPFALNVDSPDQLKKFFYETLSLPPHHTFAKGKRTVTCNREALEGFMAFRFGAIFARYIILLRDLKKKIDVLRKAVDDDGRMRCNYNVAGTDTGRWSSSKNNFGTGDNLQNWTKKMRRCMIADPGKKFISIDLSQAESFSTAGAAYRDGKDKSYLDACRSGDLHTSVCKMVWPGLTWTGNIDEDKLVAESKFYRTMSHRDTSKRLGHGSNYYGKPFQMAKQTKIDENLVRDFQLKYFKNFRGIPAYHRRQSQRLSLQNFIVTPLGRLRYFFGRPDDDATLRKAIAFEPQSTVGDSLNLGLWRIWYWMELKRGDVELVLQVHDNVVFQVPDNPDDPENDAKQSALILEALGYLQVPLRYVDETVTIGADVEVGWNWMPAKTDKKNVDGLVPWKGPGSDKRKRKSDPNATGLDRLLHRVH